MQKFRSTYSATQKWLLALRVKTINIGGRMTEQQNYNGLLCKFLFAYEAASIISSNISVQQENKCLLCQSLSKL